MLPLKGERIPLTYAGQSALGDITYATADVRSTAVARARDLAGDRVAIVSRSTDDGRRPRGRTGGLREVAAAIGLMAKARRRPT